MRDTNRRLQFAVAAGHLGIWEWDIEADVTVWNDKMFELYGVSRDGFRPSRLAWLTSLHPDDRAMAIETALATMNGQRGYSQEYRVVTPDGTVKYIKADALLVRDANGKPTQMVGLNQDITESKLAIARLDESETRFRQVVEGAPSGIFVQTDGYFRYLNPAALALYGAETSAQLIGQPFMERVHPDCREMVAERVRTLREEGQNPPLLELQHLRLDGSVFDVQVTAAPFTFGASESSVCFLRDISDRKRAERERSQIEEQFRHAQKMESIGRMAGGVSHDFNNLLTVINGYTDLLSRALKEGDPLRDWVAEIGKAGEKAAGLTRQLLAFSRKQILAPKPLDLNSTVVENRDMLHRLLGEDIDLVTDLAPDLGQVMADPGQIHQVLMNLVVNAQDAMSGGGRLTIQTANIDAGQDEAATHCGIVPGQYVLLAVSDTGSGIEKAIQDRIFDPFFTTKGEGEGTGLGLSTVYGIVQQCGGSISLSSEMGKGTTFKIHLPRFTAAISASQSVDPGRSNLRGMETVLVVEDQEPVRQLVVRTLKNCGYRVLEADQGAAALLLAESESGPIHLLITDVVMPHMTGRELAERFLLLRPEAKVIYMSGYETDVLARRGALNSEAQYIAKPFAQGALAAKVRATLGPPPSAARILVVEDEVSVRTLFRKLLEDSGYEVVTVAKGCQAVEMLRTREFQMVLTDLMPAGAEGIDIIQAIRREQPQLKIIAVSGALGGALRRAPEEPGVDARLIKPVSADTLLTTVRSVLA